jgi:hypothetical protein
VFHKKSHLSKFKAGGLAGEKTIEGLALDAHNPMRRHCLTIQKYSQRSHTPCVHDDSRA